MTAAVPRDISRWWLAAIVFVTGLAWLLFLATVPHLSDPRLQQHRGARWIAVILAGSTGLYGLAETTLCSIRRRTLVHPAIAFLLVLLGFTASVYLLPISPRSADTRIIPELQLTHRPQPAP